ncbi:hypothetical protein LCGC14_0897540 [marine sediment metagenome]|uniref:Uncharacterized protein n=1 Tax=marine sediment metagenome TaxID=412755 RepID=A0A0F9S496_9ZZZZ
MSEEQVESLVAIITVKSTDQPGLLSELGRVLERIIGNSVHKRGLKLDWELTIGKEGSARRLNTDLALPSKRKRGSVETNDAEDPIPTKPPPPAQTVAEVTVRIEPKHRDPDPFIPKVSTAARLKAKRMKRSK